MFDFYDKIPWPIRAANPTILTVSTVYYFHRLFHLNFMEIIGVTFCVICTLCWVVNIYLLVYRNWVGIALGHSTDLTKLGSWAVITGSTQGIGLSYAHALAKKGLNVVLLSRSAEKLSEIAQDIRQKHQVQVKTIPVDFSGGPEIYEQIENQLGELEVAILVNNVGMCYPYPEHFGDLPNGRKFCHDLINCNIVSVTMMTHIIIQGMVERKKGVVVNVGSLSSAMDTPFLSLYAASKSFLDKLTSDLDMEYREYGITFQSVIPGYVVSSMSKIKKSTMWVPTADEFVEGALKSVGLQKRTAVWLPHQILHFFLRVGLFFRRDGATMISTIIGKQFWLYGKKVMIYRKKKAGC